MGTKHIKNRLHHLALPILVQGTQTHYLLPALRLIAQTSYLDFNRLLSHDYLVKEPK
jgi:hypothetical protein